MITCKLISTHQKMVVQLYIHMHRHSMPNIYIHAYAHMYIYTEIALDKAVYSSTVSVPPKLYKSI